MALLNIKPPEVQKTQETQNQQTFIAFQQIQTWSSLVLSIQDVDYKLTNTNTNVLPVNLTTTNTNYTIMQNFTFNFTPKNPLCDVRFNLTLLGTGYIGIQLNDVIIEEIPFFNGTFSQVTFAAYEKVPTSSNKISLVWKATTGTVTLGCSKGTPCYNRVQVIEINS